MGQLISVLCFIAANLAGSDFANANALRGTSNTMCFIRPLAKFWLDKLLKSRFSLLAFFSILFMTAALPKKRKKDCLVRKMAKIEQHNFLKYNSIFTFISPIISIGHISKQVIEQPIQVILMSLVGSYCVSVEVSSFLVLYSRSKVWTLWITMF